MYSITAASTGGTIEFNTVDEVRNFLVGVVYGIILQYGVENEGSIPVDAVASIVTENFYMPEIDVDSRKIADMVSVLV